MLRVITAVVLFEGAFGERHLIGGVQPGVIFAANGDGAEIVHLSGQFGHVEMEIEELARLVPSPVGLLDVQVERYCMVAARVASATFRCVARTSFGVAAVAIAFTSRQTNHCDGHHNHKYILFHKNIHFAVQSYCFFCICANFFVLLHDNLHKSLRKDEKILLISAAVSER